MSRWNRRLLFGAIAVLVPVLAGCEAGLSAPTLQFHPASVGTDVIQNGITIDNVFVLAGPVGSAVPAGGRAGVFFALQAANGDRLVSVSAPGTASSVKLPGGSVNLPAQTLVDLGGPAPQVVLSGLSAPLSGGQTIQMNFTFAQAGTITLMVPVEPASYDFATYSPPASPAPSGSPTPGSTVVPSPGATGSATPGITPSATPTS